MGGPDPGRCCPDAAHAPALGFPSRLGGKSAGGDWLGQLPFAFLTGIFTMISFELATDLSEEAIHARVTVPKAIV